MNRLKFKVALVLAVAPGDGYSGFGQHRTPVSTLSGAGSAQGSLTVTLTVVSSVGVVTGPDGQQRIVVANAASPSDNVSSLQYLRLTDVNGSTGDASQPNGNWVNKPHKK